jgi:Flp pilus assembly pilin Flp
MRTPKSRLASDRRAVTALEYGILAAALAFVLILIFEYLGNVLATVGTPIFNAL